VRYHHIRSNDQIEIAQKSSRVIDRFPLVAIIDQAQLLSLLRMALLQRVESDPFNAIESLQEARNRN
jgi:hypothetical protein